MSVGLTFGYSAIGNLDSEIKPTITVKMEITMATMGLRMKKSAMCVRCGVYFDAAAAPGTSARTSFREDSSI